MGNVTTIKGNLFNAPKGSILIHACNTRGVWGAGIAREFAKRFPKAYSKYMSVCREQGSSLIGKCLLIQENDYVIGCLFTSKNYGRFADSTGKILDATRLAIAHLIAQNEHNRPLHTCKINSGLFGVPWHKTKEILKETGQEFTVYDF